jgi:hypothetical protein
MIRNNDLNDQYENIRDEINERNKAKSTSDRLILQYFKYSRNVKRKDLEEDLGTDTDWSN